MKIEVSIPTLMRRLLFALPLYVGLALSFAAVAGGWGLEDAKRFWRDAN